MNSNANMPLVSVVLACYNHEKYIGEAIDSIMEQTYSNFELIITDDGSSDDSRNVILARKMKYNNDPRIKCLLEEKNTSLLILEKAFSSSRGKYVCVMGGDDKAFPKKLEKQICFMEDNYDTHAACFTWVECLGEDENKKEIFNRVFNRENIAPDKMLKFMLLQGNCLNAPSAMIRMDLFRKNGGMNFDFRQLQDYRLWLKLLLNHSIHIIPEKLTYLRVVAGSLSDSTNNIGVNIRSAFEKEEIVYEIMKMVDSSTINLFFEELLFSKTDLDLKCAKIRFLIDNSEESFELISVALRLFYQYHEENGFCCELKDKYGIDRKTIYNLIADKSLNSIVLKQANSLKLLYLANTMKRIAIDSLEKSDEILVNEMLDSIDACEGTISLDHIVALYNYCFSNGKNEDDFLEVIKELKNKGVKIYN